MNHACTPAASAASIAEPPDIVRIRLWDRRSSSAVLGELFKAEQVLARWGSSARDEAVGFEVTFVDGQVVQGSHAFYEAGRRKVLFSKHIRALLDLGAAARCEAAPAGMRGAGDAPC